MYYSGQRRTNILINRCCKDGRTEKYTVSFGPASDYSGGKKLVIALALSFVADPVRVWLLCSTCSDRQHLLDLV